MSKRRTSIRIDRLTLSLPAMSETEARAVAHRVAERMATHMPTSPRAPPSTVRVTLDRRSAAPEAAARAVERALYGEDV